MRVIEAQFDLVEPFLPAMVVLSHALLVRPVFLLDKMLLLDQFELVVLQSVQEFDPLFEQSCLHWVVLHLVVVVLLLLL